MKKKKLGFDLILLGAPASGKDTQARLLEKKFAFQSVESGRYLRALERNRTKLGLLVRQRLSKGLPAPVAIIKEFLKANVRLAPKDRNLLFIGNPRLLPEAKFLKTTLEAAGRDFLVIYLKLSIPEIWERSAHRMRNIDDTKYVKERIAWHKTQVGKTVKYFERLGKLRFINGNQTIIQVDKGILKAINDYKKLRTTR